MAKFNPNPDSRNKPGADRRAARPDPDAGNGSPPPAAKTPDLEPWEPGQDFEPGLSKHDAETAQEYGSLTPASRGQAASPGKGESAETEHLRVENSELRSIVGELRQLLDEATSKSQESSDDREKEYERLLEEKTEVIRTLHIRLKEYEAQGPPAAEREAPPNEQDLLALSDELERERVQIEHERRQLEEDRRQLQDDEEGMMQQMRSMELQMAKERAELARQRNELQRLMIDLRHEIEVAQRDAALKDRLGKLQRNLQDLSGRRSEGGGESAPPAAEAPPARPKEKDSGIFKRLFGQGK